MPILKQSIFYQSIDKFLKKTTRLRTNKRQYKIYIKNITFWTKIYKHTPFVHLKISTMY